MKHKQAWGAVLRGVAIGDAWGNPNEFQSIKSLTATSPRGPECPEHLEVTDDTQMTLYLARALSKGHTGIAEIQQAIAEEFVNYTHDPDFGSRAPGITVTGSLRRLESGLSWHAATDDYSDGCGTVMRVTPAAFTEDWVGIAAFSAALTHGTPNGIASAILNAAVLRYALGVGRFVSDRLPLTLYALRLARDPQKHGLLDVGPWLKPLEINLESGFYTLAKSLDAARKALPGLVADPWATDPCEIGGGGWRAHECLTVALLAADTLPHDPWEALRRAVTTDGDSDSIGAVAGGLLAAVHGRFWPQGTVERLEPRYQAWIAEADDYHLTTTHEQRSRHS